jgi:hypothetical protein
LRKELQEFFNPEMLLHKVSGPIIPTFDLIVGIFQLQGLSDLFVLSFISRSFVVTRLVISKEKRPDREELFLAIFLVLV